ncbi:unnamed protein product [Polarella glacialis]|uniref:Uncharacterized protein n=1 Tax=Polarella glacialis TaxID=89957 RepID=A0A813GJ31_POLGL|nr:unnamed protein product [Polarella glacialis]
MPRAIWRELRSQCPSLPADLPVPDGQQPRSNKRKLEGRHASIVIQAPAEEAKEEPSENRLADNTSVASLQTIDADVAVQQHGLPVIVEVDQSEGEDPMRRFHANSMMFLNSNPQEQQSRINLWDQQIANAEGPLLCGLLQQAIAAMSAPRRKHAAVDLGALDEEGEEEEEPGMPMPQDAIERLKSNVQGKLRRCILQGLSRLQLDEVTTGLLEPGLSFLKILMDKFSSINGSSMDEARAGKQWMKLHGLVVRGHSGRPMLTNRQPDLPPTDNQGEEPQGVLRRGKKCRRRGVEANVPIQTTGDLMDMHESDSSLLSHASESVVETTSQEDRAPPDVHQADSAVLVSESAVVADMPSQKVACLPDLHRRDNPGSGLLQDPPEVQAFIPSRKLRNSQYARCLDKPVLLSCQTCRHKLVSSWVWQIGKERRGMKPVHCASGGSCRGVYELFAETLINSDFEM